MAHVLVLAGGTSSEREVSLRSGAAVAQALQTAGHAVTQHDPATAPSPAIYTMIDVAFPVLHGAGGEDGTIQRVLEDVGVSYVGSGVTASALCFDKYDYKLFLQKHALPLPSGTLVNEPDPAHFAEYHAGFVLKPSTGGSSIDTYIYRGNGPVNHSLIEDIFTRHDRMLLEELIVGTEVTVGVVGEEALPVIEIVPPSDSEFNYENKYNGKTAELCPPESVSQALQDKARELARQAHQLCGCRDFSRTDIMITPSGELYILETNTIPGMTDQSLLPKAARIAGLGMPELCDQLVRFALDRTS